MILRITFLVCAGLAFVVPGLGQQPDSSTSTGSSPVAGSSSTTTTVQTPKPPEEPYILEDGGISIEPIYWLNRAQPSLSGGAAASAVGSLDYAGNANYSEGGELGIPAGRSNSLRFSYFRTQGYANATLSQAETIFSESYNAGDYLNANYLIESVKLSWDYLSYTWHKPAGPIRLKTLYEAQMVFAGTNVIAPLKPVTTNSSTDETDYNNTHGTRNLILPTLGVDFEQRLRRHFRWDVKASGFAIPHHGDIWGAEGSLAARFAQFEILAGEKAYHFKTSPQAAEYFVDTLSGAYVGIRYYWKTQE